MFFARWKLSPLFMFQSVVLQSSDRVPTHFPFQNSIFLSMKTRLARKSGSLWPALSHRGALARALSQGRSGPRSLTGALWPALSHSGTLSGPLSLTVVNILTALAAPNARKNTCLYDQFIFLETLNFISENRIGAIVWKHKYFSILSFLFCPYLSRPGND